MAYTLINAGPSPFGRKVAVALIEKGLDYTTQYDLPWSDQTCTPQYSPLQQLPILITEDGKNIYDSQYILEWLERRFPKKPLVPADTDAALETKLRQLLGERLLEVMGSLAFEAIRSDPSEAWMQRQEKKVVGIFQELDRLVANRNIKDGDPIDLGDVAIGPALLVLESSVGFGHCPDMDVLKWRGRYANLTDYMTWLEKRPSFAATPYKTMDFDTKSAVA